MENDKMELNLEDMELANGGWDLKSLWKKIRGWIADASSDRN